MQNPSHHRPTTNQAHETKKMIGGIHGYGDNDKLFLIVVYEGDETGHYLSEDDEGFIEVAREIARTSRHALLIERWLEQHDKQYKEGAQ